MRRILVNENRRRFRRHRVAEDLPGAPLRVSPVAVGNQRFFAFLLGPGQSIRHWTAYDAAGKAIASGTAASQ